MRRARASWSTFRDDSVVVSDSDEDESPGNATKFTETRLIEESDEDERSSQDEENASDHKSDTDSGTVNSEEEDLEFLCKSLRESIEGTSDSESEQSETPHVTKTNKLKRRSIYESARKSSQNSTPATVQPKKKRTRVNRISSESDSESVSESFSVNQKKQRELSRKTLSFDNDTEDETHFEESYSQEETETPSKRTQIKTKNGLTTPRKNIVNRQPQLFNEDVDEDDDDDDVEEVEDVDKDESMQEEINNLDGNKSSLKNLQMVNESPDIVRSPNNKSKRNSSRQHNFSSLLEDSSDSSTNYSKDKVNVSQAGKKKESIQNNEFIDLTAFKSAEKNVEDEIIICNSTSTSESEIDNDVIAIANKEIGVGNIDPIIAQQKEYFLIKIESLQKTLDKLNKFASSCDVDKLPDKGKKVREKIDEHIKEIMDLKTKLDKLERKSVSKVRNSNQTSKIKSESTVSPKINKILETPVSGKKNNIKKEINIKNEIDIQNENKRSEFSNRFEEFDVKEIPLVPEKGFRTDDLGKKALETLNKQQSLTNKRLEQLHGSLTSRPTEDQREEDPKGLKVSLMPHQQHALAWMKWRENQKPRGGILADDMGLGKTLTMISLVLATVDQVEMKHKSSSDDDTSSDDNEWYSRNKRKRYYGGTLVVCPASLIKQWESEVNKRVHRGLLSVLVYHGNNRKIDDRKLSKYNIVVTTYQIIVREADVETGFYRMEWDRIILDEAHYIRNHKSKACMSVCGLSAKRRWTLTGTPIQNKEMDLFAILKFLHCSPFDDLQVWKRWVDNRNDAGKQRLITIMKTIMLRRTKQELQAKGGLQSLPDKNMEVVEIELDRDEHLVYQKILLFSRNLFAEFLAQRADKYHTRELYAGKFDRPSAAGAATQFTKAQNILLQHHSKIKNQNIESHEILVLLLRLRQMCCHPALIHKMLDAQEAEVNGLDEDDMNEDVISQLQDMSINEEEQVDEHAANYKLDTKVATNLLTRKNPVFNESRQSSKVRAVVRTIKELIDKNDKIVVVSQWTSFLKVIASNLVDVEDAHYAMFTGEVAVKSRQEIIDKFNDPKSRVNILFLSLTAGGVGLNLVGANHLLLVDIHWNPQLEAQAQDRIYRFGQKKSVYIYKFLCKDTIEQRIKMLQEKKLAIADHVLTGTRSVSSKLTIEDLKLLFS